MNTYKIKFNFSYLRKNILKRAGGWVEMESPLTMAQMQVDPELKAALTSHTEEEYDCKVLSLEIAQIELYI